MDKKDFDQLLTSIRQAGAIRRMKGEAEKKMRTQRLRQASLHAREESMKTNAEFSEIEHEPEN